MNKDGFISIIDGVENHNKPKLDLAEIKTILNPKKIYLRPLKNSIIYQIRNITHEIMKILIQDLTQVYFG